MAELMRTNLSDAEDWVCQAWEELGLFEGLSAEEREVLAGVAQASEHLPNERLHTEGTWAHSVTILAEGMALEERKGQAVGLYDVEPGDGYGPGVIGVVEAVDGEPRASTITSVTPVRLLEVPMEAFRTLLTECPRFGENVAGYLAHEAQGLYDRLEAQDVQNQDFFQAGSARLMPGPHVIDAPEVLCFVLEESVDVLERMLPEGQVLSLLDSCGGRYLLVFSLGQTVSHLIGDDPFEQAFNHSEALVLIPCLDGNEEPALFCPVAYADSYLALILGRELYGFPKRYGDSHHEEPTPERRGELNLVVAGRPTLVASWEGAGDGLASEACADLLHGGSRLGSAPHYLFQALEGLREPGGRLRLLVHRAIPSESSEVELTLTTSELAEVWLEGHGSASFRALEDPRVQLLDVRYPLGGRCVGAVGTALELVSRKGRVVHDFLAGGRRPSLPRRLAHAIREALPRPHTASAPPEQTSTPPPRLVGSRGTDALVEELLRHELLEGLVLPELEDAHAALNSYEAGSLIPIHDGEPDSGRLCFVLEGHACVVREGQVRAIYEPPKSFGLTTTLTGTAPSTTVLAHTPATVFELPQARFQELLAESPEFRNNVVTAMTRRVRTLYGRVDKQHNQNRDFFAKRNARLVPGPYRAAPFEMFLLVMEADSAEEIEELFPTERVGPGRLFSACTPMLARRYLLALCDFSKFGCLSPLGQELHFSYTEASFFIPCFGPALLPGVYCPLMFPDSSIAIIIGRELYGFPKRHAELERGSSHEGRAGLSLVLDGQLTMQGSWGRDLRGVSDGEYAVEIADLLLTGGALSRHLGPTARRLLESPAELAMRLGRGVMRRGEAPPTMPVFVRRQVVDEARHGEQRFTLDRLVEIPFHVQSLSRFQELEAPRVEWLDESFPLKGRCLGGFRLEMGFEFGRARRMCDFQSGETHILEGHLHYALHLANTALSAAGVSIQGLTGWVTGGDRV